MSEQQSKPSTDRRVLDALRDAHQRLDEMERQRSEPIAVVGIGCRFPGGVDSPERYWELLSNGVDAMSEVPKDRWDLDAFYDPDPDAPGKMYVREAGFIDDAAGFDAEFFRILPREAVSMDPQQRLLLEVAWEALEDAGQSPDRLRGSDTGFFMGLSWHDYERNVYGMNPERLDAYAGMGNTPSIAVGRLAFVLGAHGPTAQVDTACSASLVAVHLACQSLRLGEARTMLAGGVNLMISPLSTVFCCKIRALAPDGRCKTFDASADGYARGEGCGIVVLKRLEDALADGDSIRAVIRGSAINHDGPASGLTVPNRRAQQRVIERALANARVDPLEVSYVEAHGTATSLGDPIEIGALGDALGKNRSADRPLRVGSVKTNFGHLEAAAGIAGLIKVVLALERGEIPPHLHFRDPSPNIDWDAFPVIVPTERTPWARGKRIAGVSSFGFSGTNAHVVLEEAPPVVRGEERFERSSELLCLSAKTEEALSELAKRYAAFLSGGTDARLTDVSFTANSGRADFAERLAVSGASAAELSGQLVRFASEGAVDGMARGRVSGGERPRVAFLFTGQGSQWVGMGRELYDTQPVFRQELDRCDEILREQLEQPLLAVMLRLDPDTSPLNETRYTQPALFALEWSLAQLWRSWGVEPSVLLGHSVGEYVAACQAGVFSLEEGLRLIAARGRLMQALPSGGSMVAVLCDEPRVVEALAGFENEVSLAAVNGPRSMVVSGRRDAVEAALEPLRASGVETRELVVSHAFHSPLMEPMLDAFEGIADEVRKGSPELPIVSNVTGELAGEEIATAAYWRRHVRSPVRFASGMKTLLRLGADVFLEAGPAPVLLGMGRQCLPEETGPWLPSLRRGHSDWKQMLDSLAQLYVRGQSIDWERYERGYHPRRIPLPTYPFQRRRFWVEPEGYGTGRKSEDTQDPGRHPVLGEDLYERVWRPRTLPAPSASSDAKRPGTWLLFDDGELGAFVGARLESLGLSTVRVKSAKTYERQSAVEYRIDTRAPSDYERVLRESTAEGMPPLRGIVHLWSIEDGATAISGDSIESARNRGCGSVLYALQALVRASFGSQPRLWIVTRGTQAVEGGDAIVDPVQASLWGLGATIALEHPETRCVRVDLGAATRGERELESELLCQDLVHDAGDDQIAYRHGRRYAARLAHYAPTAGGEIATDGNHGTSIDVIATRAERAFEVTTHATRLDSDFDGRASYLVTGGLGGLGLQVARWLVDRGARRIALMSRRPRPEARLAIEELERAGAEVLTLSADVSRRDELEGALKQVRALAPLRGVVHAAGVIDSSLLSELTVERMRAVMLPKISGTWYLHEATLDSSLDFFVCFSSAASLLGSHGQGSYSAANAFLDAFMQYRRQRGLPGLSIDWGPWSDVGMAASEGSARRLSEIGWRPIAPVRATTLLGDLLRQPSAQVAVLPLDWARFLKLFPPGQRPAFLDEIASPSIESTGERAEPMRVGERFLRAALESRRSVLVDYLQSEVARIARLEVSSLANTTRSFNELGLDSLMYMELRNAILTELGTSIPLAEFLNGTSITALAEMLHRHLAIARMSADQGGTDHHDGAKEDEVTL